MTASNLPSSRSPLDAGELDALAADLPRWQVQACCLCREVEAPSFMDAIEVVRRIAVVAEQLDHHPDIDIRWRTVRLSLATHSAGGVVTAYDAALARRIDDIAQGLA